jgi:DNA-binding NtrC family response regulator
MTTKTILLVEDQTEICNYVELALRFEGYRVVVARDGSTLGDLIQSANGHLSMVLLDLMLPGQDGLETIRELRKSHPHLPILVFTGDTTAALTRDVVQSGGTGFLSKPFTHEQLLRAIHQAMQAGGAARPKPTSGADACEVGFFCQNRRMLAIRDAIQHIANSDVPVVLCGESGVGKEVVARAIHANSTRRNKPFVKINCVALPSELLESELFGYERGAFTGAMKNTPGKFEAAEGGVILLDEIGDMDFKLQAKLLHVLQDHEFQRLGSRETVRVNVRVLAAIHCDLELAIRERRFREDLYYRLNVITIRVPPLRERKDEILPLAHIFLTKHSLPGVPIPEIPPVLEHALLAHSWPGNIRELENVIRRYLVFPDPGLLVKELEAQVSRDAQIQETAGWTPQKTPAIRPMPERPRVRSVNEWKLIDRPQESVLDGFQALRSEQEREAIIEALEQAQWNRVRAAALLNIDYRKLLYRIRVHGIAPSRARPRSAPAPKGRLTAIS